MAIVNTHYGFCAKGGAVPKFTYTGEYNVRDDGVVELLTSGTIVFLEPKVIDLFMVGGGGGGGYGLNTYSSGGGGGGGYTRTVRRISVTANSQLPVTIGAGGNGGSNKTNGNSSTFDSYTVNGGIAGAYADAGAGGSGGGGAVNNNSDFGSGGSNGNSGEHGYPKSNDGGIGQGFTTREFGESTGKLYAGGGGGGRYMASQTPIISSGGTGGGGSGAWYGDTPELSQDAAAGVANTGGGGGGGVTRTSTQHYFGASGGSGIVCFRDAQELPELAGTWVLNQRLYAPENQVSYTGSYTLNGSANKTQMVVNSSYLINYIGAQAYQDYNFSTNTWRTTNFDRTLIFPAGATASDEFRTWLASNAIKQS